MLWRSRYLLIFLAAWLLGLCWALSSPVGSSPDDNYHLTTIYCETGDESLCRDVDGPGPGYEVEVPAELLAVACYAFNDEASGECANVDESATARNDHYNRTGDYPPTFYAALSLFAGDDVFRSVLLMRLFALTVALVVLGLSLLAASELRDSQLVAWSIGSVPLAMFLLPSTNPSSWAMTGLIAMWPAGYGLLHASGAARLALAGTATLAAAILATSRGDTAGIAAGMLGLICLVYARSKAQVLVAGGALVLAAGLAFTFLASGQSGSLEEGLVGSSTSSGIPLLWNNLITLPELWAGSFGAIWGLGWLDTIMPGAVWVPTIAIVGALGLIGLARIRAQRGMMLLAMAGVAIVYPVLILQLSGAVVGTQYQPRYVLPVLLVLFGISLSPLDGNHVRLTTPQRVLTTTGLVVAASIALHSQLRRYVTGTDVLSPNLNASAEWSYGWLSPMAVWIIGSLAALVLFTLIVRLMRPGELAPQRSTLSVDDRAPAASGPSRRDEWQQSANSGEPTNPGDSA